MGGPGGQGRTRCAFLRWCAARETRWEAQGVPRGRGEGEYEGVDPWVLTLSSARSQRTLSATARSGLVVLVVGVACSDVISRWVGRDGWPRRAGGARDVRRERRGGRPRGRGEGSTGYASAARAFISPSTAFEQARGGALGAGGGRVGFAGGGLF